MRMTRLSHPCRPSAGDPEIFQHSDGTHLLSVENSNMDYITVFKTNQVVFANFAKTFDQPILLGLIFTPGPIVEATVQERMYWPFAAAGFARTIAPSSASKFS